MASTAMDYEPTNGDRFDDDAAPYERDDRRSPSPRRDDSHEAQESAPRRSVSPGAGDRPKDDAGSSRTGGDEDGAVNPGSNLFVTGINPRLSEAEVSRMFQKYGEVEKCQIMRDPHTKESRGFGFVKMVTSDQADAARDGLQGEVVEGRSLSIEKARRARPRTPTPGKYFGPPKRDPRGGGGGGRFDRFDDRRRGGGGGGGGRDDPYRYRGYDRRYEDRGGGGYDRGYREDRGYDRGGDRGGYDRGYDRGGYERGGGGGRGFDREDRGDRGDRGGFREDRGYDRRDRDEPYSGGGRGDRGDRYGPRDGPREDRERYSGPREDRRGGGYDRADRDGPRSREPGPAGPAAYADAPPREREYSQRA